MRIKHNSLAVKKPNRKTEEKLYFPLNLVSNSGLNLSFGSLRPPFAKPFILTYTQHCNVSK